LKRFSTTCYGTQPTLSDIRDEKTKMRNEIDPKSKEYEEWFLNYIPGKTKKVNKKNEKQNKSKTKKPNQRKNKTKKKN
jgi:hypothetical protein